MRAETEEGQVAQKPIPQSDHSSEDKFTRLELAKTLGELVKVGLIEPIRSGEAHGKTFRAVTRYRLTGRRP